MHTIKTLMEDLKELGIEFGMNLIVHSSLKSIGNVCGGVSSIIIALERIIGDNGTIAMPTHTSGLTDPSGWNFPPVPESDWKTIRDEMPPYEKDLTPTRNMGFIPETFRKQNGTLRSNHPHYSWAARGKNAEFIVSNHSLEKSSGEGSPIARLYELDAWILLIGVGHSVNTSLHLSEIRSENGRNKIIKNGAPILIDGKRQWIEFQDYELNESDFETIGNDFETHGNVKNGKFGDSNSKLMRQKELVDFGVVCMNK